MSSVLYDNPGPKAKLRNLILTIAFGLALLGLLLYIYRRFEARGQWDAAKWEPFLTSKVWTEFIIPGLLYTLSAAAVGMVLSLVFAVIFAAGRLSDHAWLRVPAGAVVEFFRAVPLLLMIFFLFFGVPYLTEQPMPVFWALVIGLTLYNGSVLAEAFRAGIRAVPRGQTEAAYAIGMRKSQVMTYILVPQAARSMLPVIVSQLVVLLKDTALGYIIAYPELLSRANEINANYGNLIATAIVIATIYIVINYALTWFAGWLERRTRRRAGRSVTRAATAATDIDAGA